MILDPERQQNKKQKKYHNQNVYIELKSYEWAKWRIDETHWDTFQGTVHILTDSFFIRWHNDGSMGTHQFVLMPFPTFILCQLPQRHHHHQSSSQCCFTFVVAPFWRSIVAHDLAYPNQHDVHIQQIHRVVGIHQIVDRADCTMTMNSNSICLQKLRMLTRSGYFFISIFNDAPAACRPVSIIHTHIHDTTYTDQSEWKQNVSW